MTACFAERTVVDGHGAVPLPPGLPLWQAALLGCGVMTGFGAVRNVGHVGTGESVAVIGCGGVGLQVVAAAALAGAWPLIAIDRDPAKLEIARRRGATHVIDASTTDPREAVLELNAGGVDHAFEVVGRPETMRLAWELLRPAATAVVVGLAPAGVEVSFPAIDFLSDKGIRGSYYGSGDPAADLPALAELAVTGELDLSDVVTHVSDLDGVNDALERLRRGEGARTVLVLDADLAGSEALSAVSLAPLPSVPDVMHGVVLTGHGGTDTLAYREDIAAPVRRRRRRADPRRSRGRQQHRHQHADRVVLEGGRDGNGRHRRRLLEADATDDGGAWSGVPLAFPRIQGADCCGRIVRVGGGVPDESDR